MAFRGIVMNERVYFKGNAVIDEQLNMLEADDEIKNFFFMGEESNNNGFALARIIHPADMSIMENAVKTVKNEHNSVAAIRIADKTGRYRWILAVMENVPDSTEHKRTIKLSLNDIDSMLKMSDMSNGISSYMEYFSLMEYLMFSYDVFTDRLRIFMMGSSQQVNFYNGTLADWRSTMLANGNVDDVTRNIFDNLCDDFSGGSEVFEREFKMKIFENSQGMEWCLVKGKTIVDFNGKKHVIATMSKINPVNDEHRICFNLDAIDAGTDILNKRAITEYTKKLIASKPDKAVTIAIIDIDNFKTINDEFGHMFGDEVIRNVADVIKASVEGKGVAGRIGGDEMFIVVEGLENNEEIRQVLRTIRNNVSFMYKNQPDKPHVTCSIGSSTYPTDGSSYEELFNIADKMLYLAKEKGKNRYIIFLPDLHGDYLRGDGMAKAETYMFYKYKKIGVINEIINSYRANGGESLSEAARKVMLAFSLDSIFVYQRHSRYWQRRVIIGDEDICEDNSYLNNKEYIADFTEDGIEVIDNIHFFERRAKETVDAFLKMGINQAVQIIVKEHGDDDLIVSFNRNKQMSKWSEMDIVYLAILGNVFGMGYCDD